MTNRNAALLALRSKFKVKQISSSSHILPSIKNDKIKIPRLFDQARTFSERSNHEKAARVYVTGNESDSDSDIEKRTKKDAYTSEFWRQKMRTMHGIFDVNNDGVISFDDFVMLAEKFGDLGHLSKQEMADFLNVLKSIWETNWGAVEPYNTISVEQYLNDMYRVVTDKSLKKNVHKFLPYLFQAVDMDSNGNISIAEFKLFFKCLGLTERDAERSFLAIDTDGNGVLSIKEFVKLGREFFLTENPKRVSKNFWGPLASPH